MWGLRRQGTGNRHPSENHRSLPCWQLGEGGAARRAFSPCRGAGLRRPAGIVSGWSAAGLPLARRGRRGDFDRPSGACAGNAFSPPERPGAGRSPRMDAPYYRRLRGSFCRGRAGLPWPGGSVTLSQKRAENSSYSPRDKTCQNAVQKRLFMLY